MSPPFVLLLVVVLLLLLLLCLARQIERLTSDALKSAAALNVDDAEKRLVALGQQLNQVKSELAAEQRAAELEASTQIKALTESKEEAIEALRQACAAEKEAAVAAERQVAKDPVRATKFAAQERARGNTVRVRPGMKKMNRHESLREYFEFFDKDGSGVIEPDGTVSEVPAT